MADSSEAVKRERKPKQLPGEEVVALMDSFGVALQPAEREEMLEINDELAMKSFLSVNLGASMEPSRMLAMSVYSSWLCRKIEILPLIFTQQLYALESCKKVLDDCEQQLNAPHKDSQDGNPREISDEYRVGLLRTKLMALQCMGTLSSKASKLAMLVKPPKRDATKHKGVAPDVLNQIGIHVHRDDTVTVTDERKVS